jgi:GMP synthase (glutamine-hydrolysing)
VNVAVIHHLDPPFLGHVRVLRDAGLELLECSRHAGEPLPELAGLDGVVSLGGDQSAVPGGDEPLLAPEVAFLQEAALAGLPVLGICLGGQLLARALGGRVRHAGRAVEWRELRRTPEGVDDPLLGALDDPFPALHFNEDVFDAPPGAAVLAGPAPDGAAAFRWGARAWGLQYHPDADEPVLDRWIEEYARDVGDPAAFRAACAAWAGEQARTSAKLFGRFAAIVHDGVPA